MYFNILSSLRKFYFTTMSRLTVTEYLYQNLPRICWVCRNRNQVFPHLRLMVDNFIGGRRGRNSMIVGFTAAYAISVYYY